MNRRTSLKSLVVLVSVGASSFSIFKWLSINASPDLQVLYAKRHLIGELAEIIIPRTDTPGAKDANVQDFIIKMISACSDKKTQNNFINGLEDIEQYAQNEFAGNFLSCTKSQQTQILYYFERKSMYSTAMLNKVSNRFLGRSFFGILKDLTAEGYCTSMLGATKGLSYDYIPSTFNGCIPLTKNQKSWATK